MLLRSLKILVVLSATFALSGCFLAKVYRGPITTEKTGLAADSIRLVTLRAAVLRVKLRHLDAWNRERRERAEAYSAALADIPGLVLPRERKVARSARHLYTLSTRDRDALASRLRERGIATAVHYPRPIHLQPAMAAAGGKAGDLPVSERLSREVIQIPLYPELPLDTLERIAREIRDFCGGR